jgi:hypothetical protein
LSSEGVVLLICVGEFVGELFDCFDVTGGGVADGVAVLIEGLFDFIVFLAVKVVLQEEGLGKVLLVGQVVAAEL